MNVFATVGFLHLAGVPVEVGVRPAHELGALGLAVLVAVPGIGRLDLLAVVRGAMAEQWPSNGWVNK